MKANELRDLHSTVEKETHAAFDALLKAAGEKEIVFITEEQLKSFDIDDESYEIRNEHSGKVKDYYITSIGQDGIMAVRTEKLDQAPQPYRFSDLADSYDHFHLIGAMEEKLGL